GLDTLDGLDDLTVRESRLLHAVELLNEKILLLTTSLFREDYRCASVDAVIGAENEKPARPLSDWKAIRIVRPSFGNRRELPAISGTIRNERSGLSRKPRGPRGAAERGGERRRNPPLSARTIARDGCAIGGTQ
ncbi:hypothetical protein K6W12_21315, partial [Burkholderia multivorans]|uniref:hypothetical protein n=1 Tax=Burkholderia multivorans TaxID=87883 RepID=UPI001C98A613